MLNELILLPWTLFKYIFSIGLWGLILWSVVSYWKFYNLTEKLTGLFKPDKPKKDLDKPEDYII
jgi:hypothetical protein